MKSPVCKVKEPAEASAVPEVAFIENVSLEGDGVCTGPRTEAEQGGRKHGGGESTAMERRPRHNSLYLSLDGKITVTVRCVPARWDASRLRDGLMETFESPPVPKKATADQTQADQEKAGRFDGKADRNIIPGCVLNRSVPCVVVRQEQTGESKKTKIEEFHRADPPVWFHSRCNGA